MKNICAEMNDKLADLLFDPAAAPAKVRIHVEGCDRCRRELDELLASTAGRNFVNHNNPVIEKPCS